MQPKMFVTLHSPDEIRDFCRFCNQFDDAIDLLSGPMMTDAKSLMGSLLMDYSKPIEVVYQCYDDVDSFNALKRRRKLSSPLLIRKRLLPVGNNPLSIFPLSSLGRGFYCSMAVFNFFIIRFSRRLM